MDLGQVSGTYNVEDTREQVAAEATMLCRGYPAILHSQARSMAQEAMCRRKRCCKGIEVCV